MRLLLVFLLLAVTCLAQDSEALFQQANAKAAAKDYKAALTLYDEALKATPDNAACLFNAGLAAYLSGDFKRAVSYWEGFRKAAPDEVRGRAKLIQALQASGRNADAEAQVKQLVQLWNTGGVHDPTMVEERSFVRDQFSVGKDDVMAFQFFAPDPKKREHTYDFVVLREGKRQAMLYVMFDPVASQQGQYYFDMSNAKGRGNLGITRRKPTYEEAAALVRRVLQGEKVGPLIDLPGSAWKDYKEK